MAGNFVMDIIKTAIGRIGVIREPVLAFALLAAIIIGLGGIYLVDHNNTNFHKHGIIMIYISVAMLFASLGIYVWMLDKLPGTTQEVALNEGV
ncbi:MAG: hypothetical protein QF926_07815 [Alphaproteobacteria bacterium]|nr:hypothetical protein [Alphaproteobacteria bacterium]MDP6516512.1 hypothetical protein [Alphaproteobacteria bacterium]